MKNNRLLKFAGISIYIILLVLISLYVFIANDESQPLIEIFQLKYLIPVLIYSGGTLFLCYLIFRLLKRFINRLISFPVSIMLGVPLGLILISRVFELITRINT